MMGVKGHGEDEKSKTVYDVFIERGFIEKVTDEEKVPEILEGKGYLLYRLRPYRFKFSRREFGAHHVTCPHAKTWTSTDFLSGRWDRIGWGSKW